MLPGTSTTRGAWGVADISQGPVFCVEAQSPTIKDEVMDDSSMAEGSRLDGVTPARAAGELRYALVQLTTSHHAGQTARARVSPPRP